MIRKLVIGLALLAATAAADPAVLENGLIVTGALDVVGGPITENGETNATRPWVEAQILDSTGAVAQATAGRFARITEPVLSWSLNPTGTWYDAGGGVMTNDDGWATTCIVTNDGLYSEDWANAYIRSPVSTNGLSALSVGIATQYNLYVWRAETSVDTNVLEFAYDYSASGSVRTNEAAAAYVTITFDDMAPIPDATNYVLVSAVDVYGWTTPAYVGTTNDQRGQHLLVREASLPDEPVAYSQFTGAVAALQISVGAAGWSGHAAIAPVDLAGHPLRWDSAYSSSVETGALVFAWHGNPIVRMSAGSYLALTNPAIVGASLEGTNITLIVEASTGWRPYPEWSLDMESWTLMDTNEFESTYPTQSNGTYTLTFGAPHTSAFYRAWSTNEAGGSIIGSFDVLSEEFLHRGAPVATVPVLTAAVAEASALATGAQGTADSALAKASSINVFTPTIVSTNVSGTWTVTLSTNAPVAVYVQTDNITNCVFVVDSTNDLVIGNALIFGSGGSVDWPVSGLDWGSFQSPTLVSGKWNSVYFEAWRGQVNGVYNGARQ